MGVPTLICSPSENSRIRYVLGMPGNRNLLVVGLNPNTADSFMLDPTSRNVQRLALSNGFDGWYLVNLYPLRCPSPHQLPDKADHVLVRQNFSQLNRLIRKKDLQDVVLSWGNGIALRPYLQNAAEAIRELIKEHRLKSYCYRLNKSGHPSHLSPRNVNRFFRSTDPLPLIPQVG